MKNVYIASVNPMHFSHRNTLKEAEKKLGEKVYLCIGQNALKNGGLFSLEERAYIANHFYGIPMEQIKLLPTRDTALDVIKNAQNIVRGIRNEKDLLELQKLAEHYGVNEESSKLFPIIVPYKMKEISSSLLIKKIISGEYNPTDQWIPESLLLLIKEKLNL